MEVKAAPRGLLSGNALKLIAAAAMLADHAGLMFFPQNALFRILGRLALPIFAFMIAEGCKYTRSRLRYFLGIFLLGTVCQVVYYIFDGSLYFSILITFSLSIPVIYALQQFRVCLFSPDCPPWRTVLSAALLTGAVALVWQLNRIATIDYGFWGCMLPVFATLPRQRRAAQKDALSKLDDPQTAVLSMGIGLVLLCLDSHGLQWYSLLALPLLLCYSGRRGKGNLKYFFYIFYPLHLAALQGIKMLLQIW